jgi:hypothetical protein
MGDLSISNAQFIPSLNCTASQWWRRPALRNPEVLIRAGCGCQGTLVIKTTSLVILPLAKASLFPSAEYANEKMCPAVNCVTCSVGLPSRGCLHMFETPSLSRNNSRARESTVQDIGRYPTCSSARSSLWISKRFSIAPSRANNRNPAERPLWEIIVVQGYKLGIR